MPDDRLQPTLSDDEIARSDPDLCEHGWSRLHPQPCPECEDETIYSDPPMRAGCPTPAMCDELMICAGACAGESLSDPPWCAWCGGTCACEDYDD